MPSGSASPLLARLLHAARRRLLPMAHEDADHVVALLDEQMGRDAGIDSATHGQHNARHTAFESRHRCVLVRRTKRIIRRVGQAVPARIASCQAKPDLRHMEKEYVDRAKAIREGILQLRDSL